MSVSPARRLQPLLYPGWSPVDGCDWMWQSLPPATLAPPWMICNPCSNPDDLQPCSIQDSPQLMDVTECDSLFPTSHLQPLLYPGWSATLVPPRMISSWWMWLNMTVFTRHPSSNPCSTPDDLQLMAVSEYDSLYQTPLQQPLLYPGWPPVDGCDWMWQFLPDTPPASLAPPRVTSSWWLWLNVTVFTRHPSGKPCSTQSEFQLTAVTECDSLYQTPLQQALHHPEWVPVDSCDWMWQSLPDTSPTTLAPPSMICIWWLWLNVTVFTWHPSCNLAPIWDDLKLMAVLILTAVRHGRPHPTDFCETWQSSSHWLLWYMAVLIPLTAVWHGRPYPPVRHGSPHPTDCCETWQTSSHWLLWDMAVFIPLIAVGHGRPHPADFCETWQTSSHWLLWDMADLIPLTAVWHGRPYSPVRHGSPHPTDCCETWQTSSHWLLYDMADPILWDMAVLIPLTAVRHGRPHPTDCCMT